MPRSTLSKVAGYTLLVIVAFIFAFPVVFMVMSSLKTNEAIFADMRSIRAFLPVGQISFNNYLEAFLRTDAWRFIFNSVIIATFTVILGLFFNSMAAFALARMKWRGQTIVLAIIIATLIVPFETIAIPLLLMVSRLPYLTLSNGTPEIVNTWLDTYHVQIIPFIANAFSIFLFYQYFREIPKDLDEAALVDGANRFQIYRHIIMPISGPIIATVAILTFLPAWNAYLWPIMVIQSESARPVMIGMQFFFLRVVEWGEVMAYATAITLPVLVLYLSFQRAFIESIATSGIKG
ncbi:MAG: carbohydrate ABC transporter permease [Anaerolineaceae bacterium]|nr:carbohydrate ABC transporter permease [Anaerolineaceae bacterium]